MIEKITSAKNCRRDKMILLFTSAITSAFAECQRELERLLKRLTICYCCFCLNELFLVLQETFVQRTLMNSIHLMLCFCFVLHCSSFQCLFCKCTTFFLPCVVYKTKIFFAIQFLLKTSVHFHVSQCFQLCSSRCV